MKSMRAAFGWLETRSQSVFQRFAPTFDEALYQRVLECSRIMFALVMLMRYLRTLDALFLFPQTSLVFVTAFIVLYVFLALGFLTPLVLVALVIMEGFTPLFIAVKINAILPLMFLLLGAGRSLSLDQIIFKRPPMVATDFPKIRFYLLLPYALLCVLAFAGHLRDANWLNGDALSQLLLNPAVSVLPEMLRERIPDYPQLFWVLSHLQLGWELLLLPALFFPWPLAIAASYGALFFAASYFVLNLSSLGLLEAIYWFLLFHQEIFHQVRRRWAP